MSVTPIWRRLAAAALACVLLPGLTACGGDDPAPESTRTSTPKGTKKPTKKPTKATASGTSASDPSNPADPTTEPGADPSTPASPPPSIRTLDEIGALIPADGSTRQKLDAAISAWAAQRSTKPSEFSVAVYDSRSQQTYLFNPDERYLTASIVKTTITSALATKRVNDGGWLSANEQRLATASITVSDNGATSALFNILGRPAGGVAFADKLGLSETTVNRGWGKTETSARDQAILMREIAYGDAGVMPERARSYVSELMGKVIPEQRWGIGGEVPKGVTFTNKNGWLPYGSGWIINSIGHVQGEDRDYVIAVLSEGQPDMQTGIKTVEGASSLVWQVLAEPLSE